MSLCCHDTFLCFNKSLHIRSLIKKDKKRQKKTKFEFIKKWEKRTDNYFKKVFTKDVHIVKLYNGVMER
jgi:hypothetical protein